MSALGRSCRKVAISPITRFSANSSVDGGLEFAEITALVPFSTPTDCLRQLSASKCSDGPVLFIWNCFLTARSRRNRQADKSDRISAQLTARHWHHADSNA